jgi:predicted RNA-binding protein associated with RNAse of E/G family
VPGLRGRVAFDARFVLLSIEQLQAISRFRNQSSPDWIASADGYRLLVLDPRDEEAAVTAVLKERGTRELYRDHRIAVLLRSGKR